MKRGDLVRHEAVPTSCGRAGEGGLAGPSDARVLNLTKLEAGATKA